MPACRALFPLCVSLIIAAASPAEAQTASASANDRWRTSLLEENDSLYFNSDRHYTQGLRLSFLSPELRPEDWMENVYGFAAHVPTVFAAAPDSHRRVAWLIGQSIFTPQNLAAKPPNPHDRPYAGWLYVGSSLLQETGNRLENLELELGVIGPGAFGRQVQNDWHQLIGVHQAQGWSNQIQNEPGGMLSYDRYWRLPLTPVLAGGDGSENGVDLVSEGGGTVGNVFDYAEAGGQLRFGRHLEADYGQVHVRPSLSGTDYFNADHLGDDLGYYVFLGVQGRAVAHNLFLAGNSFRTSPNVEHKTFVADLDAGVSVFWSDRIRVDFSVGRRTPEFVGQNGPDVMGSAAVAFSW